MHAHREDSRLHACIVCASVSCPNVRREAYRVDRLAQQMDDQVGDFLSNPKKGERGRSSPRRVPPPLKVDTVGERRNTIEHLIEDSPK